MTVADLVTHALFSIFLFRDCATIVRREGAKIEKGAVCKTHSGRKDTRHSLYREQRGWYLIFLSPSRHEIQKHI